MNTDDRRDVLARLPVDVAALRVEPGLNTVMEDHFCALCTCTKSGWADVPNMVSEWCNDQRCACHQHLAGPGAP